MSAYFTSWHKYPNIIAQSFVKATEEEIENGIVGETFFADAFSNLYERERLGRRFTIFNTLLLICILLSDVGAIGSFSFLSISFSQISDFRGAFLFILSGSVLIITVISSECKVRRACLEAAYEHKYSKNGELISRFRWGNIIDSEFGSIPDEADRYIFAGTIVNLLRYSLAAIVMIWAGGLIISYYLAWGFSLFQEWQYPSFSGLIYWVLLLLSAGAFFASVLVDIETYIPLPFKDARYLMKWGILKDTDPEAANELKRKIMSGTVSEKDLS